MNWIYDECTPHSRLMVGIDRQGVTIREWSDEVPDGETGFTIQDNFFDWNTLRNRERCYAGDDGSGKLRSRLVAGAISLLAHWGGSSDDSGIVPDLSTYINAHHLFNC